MGGTQIWVRGGRGPSWRSAMLVGGLFFVGLGVALILWPHLLAWAVAGLCLGLGTLLVLSAVFARGARR